MIGKKSFCRESFSCSGLAPDRSGRGLFTFAPKAVAIALIALTVMLFMLSGCNNRGSEGGQSPALNTPTGIKNTVTPGPTELPAPTPSPTPEPTPVPTADPDMFIENGEVLAGILCAQDPEAGAGTVTLALIADINIEEEDLLIKRPCVIRLEGHTLSVNGNIVIDTDEKGEVRFENGTLRAGSLKAQAPDIDADLTAANAEFSGAPETDGFNIILASLNGQAAPDNYIHLRSPEDYEKLTDPETLPAIRGAQTLKFEFEPELFGELPYIDLPGTDVIWETENAPGAEYASMYFNVNAYNGAEMAVYGLGGKGSAKLEKIDFNGNSGLSGQLPWEIRGNTVVLRVPLHISDDYMKYARLEIGVTDGGTYASNPEAVNGDGSIYLTRFHSLTVTDANGEVRVYSVDISRRTGNIPVIWIETENGASIDSKSDYTRCRIAVTNTQSSGFPTVAYTDAGIRGRGNSTWKWDKKPYRIKFDSGVSLFGLHKAKDWVLLANYADKSLIRNTVAFDMARGLSFDFVPHQYPVDVYLNGEYQGVYSIGEQIERNRERVELDCNYDDPDTGYLMEVCGSNDDDVKGIDYFHAGKLIFVTIKSPDTKKMSAEHFDFICSYVRSADLAVQSLGNYYDYVDATSLYDWIIMCELTCNIDTAFRRSCYITKDKGGKLKFGPLWDFDLAMGNFSRDGGDYESWACTGREYVGDTWFTFLMNDPKFTEPFKARWFEVRDDILARAMESIDRNAELLEYSQEENFTRWPIWNERTGYQPSSMKKVNTYEKQIQFLKDWLTARAAWLDSAIGAI